MCTVLQVDLSDAEKRAKELAWQVKMAAGGGQPGAGSGGTSNAVAQVGGRAGVENTLIGVGQRAAAAYQGLPRCLTGGCCCTFSSGGIEAALPRAATLPQVGGRLGGMLDLFGCAINYNRKG